MSSWAERSEAIKTRLKLRTEPIAFRRLEDAGELERIEGVIRWSQGCVFCQIPYMARVSKLTVAVTGEDKLNHRCKRVHGLVPSLAEDVEAECQQLSRTWMPSPEEAMKQQQDYPAVPPGQAIVAGPLNKASFEPDMVMVFGNPAQIMMLLCGMQKVRYESFDFTFVGEGACMDSFGRYYATGKTSVAIPCYGERALGQVADDEIVVALPPEELGRVIEGLDTLAKSGFGYPISVIGGFTDPNPFLAQVYPDRKRH
jgi:uncharacterized protein (DUF169 family)